MKDKSLYFGKQGEAKAVKYLESIGFEIIEQSWRYHRSEVDIIARQGSTLVFTEVKSRKNTILPIEELISEAQKKRIIKAAHHFITINEIDLNIRFDLLYIDASKKTAKLSHFKEFFSPDFD